MERVSSSVGGLSRSRAALTAGTVAIVKPASEETVAIANTPRARSHSGFLRGVAAWKSILNVSIESCMNIEGILWDRSLLDVLKKWLRRLGEKECV